MDLKEIGFHVRDWVASVQVSIIEDTLWIAMKLGGMAYETSWFNAEVTRVSNDFYSELTHHIYTFSINFYLFTESRCLHIFLGLKFLFYFSSPFFSVDPFNVVNFLLSHSSSTITSCIHEFRGLPFLLLLLGGNHSKVFEVAFLHPFIQFNCFISYNLKQYFSIPFFSNNIIYIYL